MIWVFVSGTVEPFRVVGGLPDGKLPMNIAEEINLVTSV